VPENLCVATLIGGKNAALDAAFIDGLVQTLNRRGLSGVRAEWLCPGKACDVFAQRIEETGFYEIIRPITGNRPIDVVVQPVEHRKKNFLLADMESTIIEQELIDEMAALIARGDEIRAITSGGMHGQIPFDESLVSRTKVFAGQPEELLKRAAATITPTPGAVELIASMKERSSPCWLVSGGYGYFAEIVANRLGFDRFFANELIVEKGRIAGRIAKPVRNGMSKKEAFDLACLEPGIKPYHILAVGDGANDEAMLKACNEFGGLGIAYRAKPCLREAIPHRIDHADLSALIYAFGFANPCPSASPSFSQSSPRQSEDRLSGPRAKGPASRPSSRP